MGNSFKVLYIICSILETQNNNTFIYMYLIIKRSNYTLLFNFFNCVSIYYVIYTVQVFLLKCPLATVRSRFSADELQIVQSEVEDTFVCFLLFYSWTRLIKVYMKRQHMCIYMAWTKIAVITVLRPTLDMCKYELCIFGNSNKLLTPDIINKTTRQRRQWFMFYFITSFVQL